jgi:uncharacterized protein with PQ loop repeat
MVLLIPTFQVDVVKSQTTESMSFPLSIMSFLTTFSWTGYGYLIGDSYVVVSKGNEEGEGEKKQFGFVLANINPCASSFHSGACVFFWGDHREGLEVPKQGVFSPLTKISLNWISKYSIKGQSKIRSLISMSFGLAFGVSLDGWVL